jgi:hypothetical protein
MDLKEEETPLCVIVMLVLVKVFRIVMLCKSVARPKYSVKTGCVDTLLREHSQLSFDRS